MSAINTYLDTGSGPNTWLVRIKPDSTRGSHTILRPSRFSITKGQGWRPLHRPGRELLVKLAAARESGKSGAPLVFDICSREEALALEQRETVKARAHDQRRTVTEALRDAPAEAPAAPAEPRPAPAPPRRGRPPKQKPPEPPQAPEPPLTPDADDEVVDVDDDFG